VTFSVHMEARDLWCGMSIRRSDDPPASNRLLTAAAVGHDAKQVLRQIQPIWLPFGHLLHGSGNPIDFVYFPTTAVVSLAHQMGNGAMTEVAVVGNEGVLGANLLLGAKTWCGCSVVKVAGGAVRMTAPSFLNYCERRSEVRKLLMRYIEVLLRQISQTAACNKHHSVEQRLSKWLLVCLDNTQGEQLQMTQHFIASMLGDRRETIAIAERRLQTAGLIQYSRGQLSVLDRSGLNARACRCYSSMQGISDLLWQ
jgi:hypothetical protein